LIADLTELMEQGKTDYYHNKMEVITEEVKLKATSNQQWISDAIYSKVSEHESDEKKNDDEEDSELFFLYFLTRNVPLVYVWRIT
jgi:hypothetical protein